MCLQISCERKKNLVEFVYMFFVNNFGAGTFAEKRLLDFFTNLKLNSPEDHKMELFCRMAQILEPYYDVDCWSFWHIMVDGLRAREKEAGSEPALIAVHHTLSEEFGFLKPETFALLQVCATACSPSEAFPFRAFSPFRRLPVCVPFPLSRPHVVCCGDRWITDGGWRVADGGWRVVNQGAL